MFLRIITLVPVTIGLSGCDPSWERAFEGALNSSSVQQTLGSTYVIEPSYARQSTSTVYATPYNDTPKPLPQPGEPGYSGFVYTPPPEKKPAATASGPILKEETGWTGFTPEEIANAERVKREHEAKQSAKIAENQERIRRENEEFRQRVCSENPRACKKNTGGDPER